MRFLCLSGAVCLCVAGVVFSQDPQFSHNAALVPTIKAYELSAAEEASFNPDDGQPSPFWAAWDKPAGASMDRAEINGVEHFTWGEATTDAEEGKCAIQIAYGDRGIYLLYTVTDDAWAGYSHWLDYANDAIELFGCQFSAQDMYNNPSTYLPCMDDPLVAHQMSANYFQLQIRFGLQALEPVEAFSLNKWNPVATDISIYGCAHSNIAYDRDVTFSEAKEVGILIDILEQTEQNKRRQEWLIPWDQWGSTNPPRISRKAKGDRLGLCFGYNDLDPLVQTNCSAMRWRKCDPYNNTGWNPPQTWTGTPPAAMTSFDAWGDIVFDAPISEVCPGCVDLSAQKVGLSHAALNAAAVGATYYTIEGKRITALHSLPKSTVVLRRMTLDNGMVRTDRVPLSQVVR